MRNDAAQPLTWGQAVPLGVAAAGAIAIGGVGAYGTYTNLHAAFPHSATALGAVAGGEGATLILALVYVGLTMLGQSAPAGIRVGLWVLPAVASATGAVAATGVMATIVYGVAPLAMCAAAEGTGLLARRIVIRTTGVDMETRRRNAATMQRLAYQRARAANHPSTRVRKWSERAAWRLARRVGVGDTELGEQLVTVQRARMTEGADAALADMFGTAGTVTGTPAIEAVPVTVPALPAPVPAPAEPGPAELLGPETGTPAAGSGTPPVPGTGTQVSPIADLPPSPAPAQAVTLAQLASVAGVPLPVPGVQLTDDQIVLVLRHLRYQDDPPISYRAARDAFRNRGFTGSEERVRKACRALQDDEETAASTG